MKFLFYFWKAKTSFRLLVDRTGHATLIEIGLEAKSAICIVSIYTKSEKGYVATLMYLEMEQRTLQFATRGECINGKQARLL